MNCLQLWELYQQFLREAMLFLLTLVIWLNLPSHFLSMQGNKHRFLPSPTPFFAGRLKLLSHLYVYCNNWDICGIASHMKGDDVWSSVFCAVLLAGARLRAAASIAASRSARAARLAIRGRSIALRSIAIMIGASARSCANRIRFLA